MHTPLTRADYVAQYQRALREPEAFWAEQAAAFLWHQPWSRVKNTSFHRPVHIAWFEGARTNLSENCLDRHLATRGNKTAIVWEGDNPDDTRNISYAELHADVCRLANALKTEGVRAGDRVTIYLPMIPEAAVAMLACARIGAVHSVVFGGFSAEALRGRIEDCGSRVVITADESVRGGKTVPLKANVDEALSHGLNVSRVMVVKRTGNAVAWNTARDRWYHEITHAADATCTPESMDAEAPLFILYTSGSTGKPKGVLHTTGGYMVWAGLTHHTTFDLQENDVFWCTADVGWITGHTYTVYGPLLGGGTTVMYEGVPHYPNFSRFWETIDRHRVSIFYTAPTAIRALMREGDAHVTRTSRRSLRLLGSVGEPINPEAWRWYHRVVGEARCPIVDTWWQTETGGHMITPLPHATPAKPGAACWPFFGVRPVLVDASGHALEGEAEGALCIADSWPGQARTVWGDHARFEETYFTHFPGLYFTGDNARRDADGDWWITGRMDDVLKISGHRIGTADVESALVAHPHVAEAAVVGVPHDIKGQGIYCYVTLHAEAAPSATLEAELTQWVRKEIGPIATPEVIHFAPGLPKTRSGKIMRRILRKIAEGETDLSALGDTSTLLDPGVVSALMSSRRA